MLRHSSGTVTPSIPNNKNTKMITLSQYGANHKTPLIHTHARTSYKGNETASKMKGAVLALDPK